MTLSSSLIDDLNRYLIVDLVATLEALKPGDICSVTYLSKSIELCLDYFNIDFYVPFSPYGKVLRLWGSIYKIAPFELKVC